MYPLLSSRTKQTGPPSASPPAGGGDVASFSSTRAAGEDATWEAGEKKEGTFSSEQPVARSLTNTVTER